jgi:uncharacterized protein with ParB-like and HNH nuclease domain
MKTERTLLTVKELLEGFEFSHEEEKGLTGWAGKLVIQPEFQRHYIYDDGVRDKEVIRSLIKGYPIGVLYFNKIGPDSYEVLDGQQRITSIGRYMKNLFAVKDDSGMEQIYHGIPQTDREIIDKSEILVYVCEGT